MTQLNTQDLACLMEPNRGYTLKDIAALLRVTTSEANSLLSSGVQNKRVARHGKCFYAAGTQPEEEREVMTPDFMSRGTMQGYDAGLRRQSELSMLIRRGM